LKETSVPTVHVVQQGEYISLIAEQYGFHSYETLWDDPANADLKQLRKNPNVLLPGDQVVIPDAAKREESAATTARHRFVAHRSPLQLRLVLKDESGEPIANTECVLGLDGRSKELQTDGQGRIVEDIPNRTQQASLLILGEGQAIELDLRVGVGSLNPLEDVTGQIARLNNLGYDAGKVEEPADDAARDRFRSAVEEFQCNEGLTVDGVCGSATQAKLKQVHGC
jgi:hypothetical protein